MPRNTKPVSKDEKGRGSAFRRNLRCCSRKEVASPSAATVGMPVTRHPPCSPGRAVFPHPVPRLHSLPRRVIPCLLSPAGRLAHAGPVRRVRDEVPFRAACFRRGLPPVVGFPHRRVLCSIRLPSRIRRAFPVTVLLRLPDPLPPRCLGSSIVPSPGFPFCASI